MLAEALLDCTGMEYFEARLAGSFERVIRLRHFGVVGDTGCLHLSQWPDRVGSWLRRCCLRKRRRRRFGGGPIGSSIMVSQFPNLSWDTVWEILDMNPVQMVDEVQWKTS